MPSGAVEYMATASTEPEVELGLSGDDLSDKDAVEHQQGQSSGLRRVVTFLGIFGFVALAMLALHVFANVSDKKNSSAKSLDKVAIQSSGGEQIPLPQLAQQAQTGGWSSTLSGGLVPQPPAVLPTYQSDQAPPFVFQAGVNKRRTPLEPPEHKHDGNVCDDNEELHAGLCYTKCAVLTKGTHPFRSTAFTCCETSQCGSNIMRMKTASILPCKGYDTSDVNGDVDCPHKPGVCLEDEELFLGECYEKCSKLTTGVYPNRVASLTCCKTEGAACMDPFNDWTSGKLAIGGGKGDNNDETPSKVHPPLKSLTEANPASPAPQKKENNRRVAAQVKPNEHMHDGNPCDDSEEVFGGMCYTKCSILTDGKYYKRKSAFTCCAEPHCGVNIFRMKTASLIPCSGFDVSSGDTGGKYRGDDGVACPHVRGTCLADEELFTGECYEKCSLLTNGTHPNRIGAATCCKSKGVGCMAPFNDWTAGSFDVGGGAGDNNAQTPKGVHFPLTRFTEATA